MDWHKIGITLTLDCRRMTEMVGGLGLTSDWPWTDIGLAGSTLDWRHICKGLTLDWHRIEVALALDGHRIGPVDAVLVMRPGDRPPWRHFGRTA